MTRKSFLKSLLACAVAPAAVGRMVAQAKPPVASRTVTAAQLDEFIRLTNAMEIPMATWLDEEIHRLKDGSYQLGYWISDGGRGAFVDKYPGVSFGVSNGRKFVEPVDSA